MKIQDLNKEIKEIKDWAKVHLKEPILNKETGFLIEVSNKGIEHTLKHDLMVDRSGRFFDLVAVIKKFKSILKDAKLVESRLDKYGKQENLIVHEFEFELEYKGELEKLQIIVKEFVVYDKKMTVNRKVFYNHRFVIDEIKKP